MLTEAEAELLAKTEVARKAVIDVDDHDSQTLTANKTLAKDNIATNNLKPKVAKTTKAA